MGLARVSGSGILARAFTYESDDQRFDRFFFEATRRPPPSTPTITTVVSVSLVSGSSETMVGLTRYSRIGYGSGATPVQKIAFFSQLIDELSDQAATAVVAHELAHAWLNEHVKPEESESREQDADALARRWGFGPELDALDHEADSVYG